VKDLLSYQVQQLLKSNNISIDSDELTFQIKSHPTYPSLHAVTGVLDHFSIENLALDIPKTPETLAQLPKTFLAQVIIDKQKQFAVISKTKYGYQLIIELKKKKQLSSTEFLKSFTGIILVIDKDESNYNEDKIKFQSIATGLMLGTVILLATTLFSTQTEVINYLLFSISAIGLVFSLAIFKQEQGESTIIGNSFCATTTDKNSCNTVLSSKGANIYKDLKLSDTSLIYFIGLTLSIFLLTISNNGVFIPQIISFIALPVVVYSIYYQARILKKWCLLCLSIATLLCANATLSAIFYQPEYNLKSLFIVLLAFSSTTLFYLSQSKILKDYKSLIKMKIEYFKFKRNFDLFKTQLEKEQAIETKIPLENEIRLGNANSNLQITIITNPLCGHCKPVHELVKGILSTYPKSAKLVVRFNVNPHNPKSISTQIATRLLEIHEENGIKSCLEAMHEIYSDATPTEWLNEWGTCSKPNFYLPILKSQFNWCAENNINFTPQILINGKSYPKIFDRQDLIYFIEDLEELSEKSNIDGSLMTTTKF